MERLPTTMGLPGPESFVQMYVGGGNASAKQSSDSCDPTVVLTSGTGLMMIRGLT